MVMHKELSNNVPDSCHNMNKNEAKGWWDGVGHVYFLARATANFGKIFDNKKMPHFVAIMHIHHGVSIRTSSRFCPHIISSQDKHNSSFLLTKKTDQKNHFLLIAI